MLKGKALGMQCDLPTDVIMPTYLIITLRLRHDNPEDAPMPFLLGVAPPGMPTDKALGEARCGVGIDRWGHVYRDGKFCPLAYLDEWSSKSKRVT